MGPDRNAQDVELKTERSRRGAADRRFRLLVLVQDLADVADCERLQIAAPALEFTVPALLDPDLGLCRRALGIEQRLVAALERRSLIRVGKFTCRRRLLRIRRL